MSREVFEELKQDEAFVEKVANRIYTESDDFEDSMPEPEWICEMTDIANKYIQRFKLANKVSNQPTLNENQQIVLDWSVGNDTLTKLIINISDVLKHPYKQPEHDDIMEQAFLTLTDEEIIQVFSVWKYEEQEEENSGE